MELKNLALEKVWLDKAIYADAECMFHEQFSKANKYESSIFCSKESSETVKAIIDLKNGFENLDARVEEKSYTAGKLTDQNTLIDTCESINFKTQKFEEIKMIDSTKSVNVSQCENCVLCEKITKCHDYNDINELLSNVELWDVNYENQYKKINNFECLVCFFKTDKFIDWKLHIMSISHMAYCHKINDLYSYVCSSGTCKLLLYGSKKCLNDHRAKHFELGSLICVQILMAEVMKRFINKQKKKLYFCSHCKKYAETPIHSKGLRFRGVKLPVIYYCKYCNVDFYSRPEIIDYHSLSVEHLTLKCLHKLCKMKWKKIKLSEKSNRNEEENLLQTVDNQKTILAGYRYCKLCSTPVYWDLKNIMSHLSVCEYQKNFTITNATSMRKFQCNLCCYYTNEFEEYEKHIISIGHITKCDDTSKYFSYFCDLCHTLMYANKTTIDNHQQQIHDDDNTVQLPRLSTFMAKIIDFNRVKPKHYFCKTKKGDEQPKNDTNFCNACKIVFHTPILDYNMHLITSEHIFMTFLMSMFVKNKKKLATTNKTETVTSNVQSIPLFQNSNYTEVDSNHVQDVQVNKNSVGDSDRDADTTILLDQKSQAVKCIPNETEYNISSNMLPTTTSCQQNEDMNMKKKMNFVDVSTFTDDLDVLNPVGMKTPGKMTDRKSQHDPELTCSETTLSLDSVTNLKNEKAEKLDEDEVYGKYVTKKLKSITNPQFKQDLLLEIDYLFSIKMKQFQQKNA